MSDLFGAPSGSLGEVAGDKNLSNSFATISDRSVADMAESDRVQPRQVTTGTQRGSQTILTDKGKVILGQVGESSSDKGIGFQFVDQTNTPRLFSGLFPDGGIKSKLSQTGSNVMNASDNELIWSSDFNSFKIVETFSPTVTVSNPADGNPHNNFTEVAIASSYGAFMGFVQSPFAVGYQSLPYTIFGSGASFYEPAIIASAFVKESAITLTVDSYSDLANGSWMFKLFTLKETASQ